MSYHSLEDLEVYNLAESFSNEIWLIVINWDYLAKATIGKQLIRSADSISANIAEGYGRYHYKEKETFVTSAEDRLWKPKAGWLRQRVGNY